LSALVCSRWHVEMVVGRYRPTGLVCGLTPPVARELSMLKLLRMHIPKAAET
jgi:hypothetical protein